MTTEAAPAEPLKYRAFLSYSRRDSAAAKRLHSRLDLAWFDEQLAALDAAAPKTAKP